ncbi:MAG: FdhF/YdeP family oxidoreductase [Planctomycetota bacterium]|jgi:molybdopterin-dependent oxidoreductase alpha subunit
MPAAKSGGGWPSILYTLRKARQAGGLLRLYRALRRPNACKTCAVGMGGQRGGMVNEAGRFPEVCKKSVQAMAADMQGALHPHFFDDFSLERLRGFTSRELEAAGRLTEPVAAGPLDSHYRRIGWDEALERVADRLRRTDPGEGFFYFSGRSSNEAAFLFQLFARLWGTSNIHNCSSYCHQPSGVALASVVGSGTSTVVLDDLDRCDLLFVIGANPASNHPRLMTPFMDLRRRGGRIVVVNPLRETGLVRFKVPSDARSLLFGSSIASDYVQPNIGGDIAFLAGVVKRVIETGAVDEAFVARHVEGWDAFAADIAATPWDRLVRESGVPRETIDRVADLYAGARNVVFCWAMGVTHHEHGVDNVRMIANLALSRGMVGAPGRGLLPLRGHSNVQGVGSMGVTPRLKPAMHERLEQLLDRRLPDGTGLDTLQSMQRAQAGGIRVAWCLGGNLYGSNPDSALATRALARVDQVVHFSTTLNTGHVHGRGRETIILPVRARDEESQPTTQESMFNLVRLSEGGPARHEGTRSEVDLITDVAARVLGATGAADWTALRDHARIRAMIAEVVPGYAAIGDIDDTRREFQIDGRTFHEPRFPTGSGRARCHRVPLPGLRPPTGDGLRVMTVRSEGQFNTVVYEDEDVYRGQRDRDVIMMSAADLDRLGLAVGARVTVRSATGALANVRVDRTDIPPGNAVMYYPEANVLVPTVADRAAGTPAFKGVDVTIERAGAGG